MVKVKPPMCSDSLCFIILLSIGQTAGKEAFLGIILLFICFNAE